MRNQTNHIWWSYVYCVVVLRWQLCNKQKKTNVDTQSLELRMTDTCTMDQPSADALMK